jgi:hypothetical protein
MDDYFSRDAATDSPNSRFARHSGLAERPDRVALWAVGLAVVAMVAGAASAKAVSGGVGPGGGGGGGNGAATDCTGKDRAAKCDDFDRFEWVRQRATWYGPGFFGNRTACGQKLTRATTGVAHKTLPCGSKVVLRYKGRYVRTRVIDRGPYAHGAKWDLTQATARSLRFEYTDEISVGKRAR